LLRFARNDDFVSVVIARGGSPEAIHTRQPRRWIASPSVHNDGLSNHYKPFKFKGTVGPAVVSRDFLSKT
jgi:hypothetical protein